jgi:hypothetical protein
MKLSLFETPTQSARYVFTESCHKSELTDRNSGQLRQFMANESQARDVVG